MTSSTAFAEKAKRWKGRSPCSVISGKELAPRSCSERLTLCRLTLHKRSGDACAGSACKRGREEEAIQSLHQFMLQLEFTTRRPQQSVPYNFAESVDGTRHIHVGRHICTDISFNENSNKMKEEMVPF